MLGDESYRKVHQRRLAKKKGARKKTGPIVIVDVEMTEVIEETLDATLCREVKARTIAEQILEDRDVPLHNVKSFLITSFTPYLCEHPRTDDQKPCMNEVQFIVDDLMLCQAHMVATVSDSKHAVTVMPQVSGVRHALKLDEPLPASLWNDAAERHKPLAAQNKEEDED